MAEYRCCWNCMYGFCAAKKTVEEEKRFAATKRICCAPFPVSNRAENPFKRRYCKQFVHKELLFSRHRSITKQEAAKMVSMSEEELIEYWSGNNG